jgi:hypothetical protein
VKSVRTRMIEMEMVVSFPRDKAPALAEVQKLSQLATALVKDIALKEPK